MKNTHKSRRTLMSHGIDAMATHGVKSFDLTSLEKVESKDFTRKGARTLTLSNGVKVLAGKNGIYERKIESDRIAELVGSNRIYGKLESLLEGGLSIIDASGIASEQATVRKDGKDITGAIIYESESVVCLLVGKAVKSFETVRNSYNAHKLASIVSRQSIK